MTNATPSMMDHRLNREEARRLDEGTLVALLLSRDDVAWAELVRRYEPVIRYQLRKVIRAAGSVLASDAIDDMTQDLYLALVEDDMAKVRHWAEGPRVARFGSWLSFLATQIAWKAIAKGKRRARTVRAVDADALMDSAETDPNRGAQWIGKMRELHIADAEAAERAEALEACRSPRRTRRRRAA